MKPEIFQDETEFIEEATSELIFKVQLGIIELLGSQLYTQLPAIISEFISNAYDADATKVDIKIVGKIENHKMNYNISIKDNGVGIASNYDDQIKGINESFLQVGRKRRQADGKDVSKMFGRKVQGKKGIGKLAGFGITDTIIVTTTCNNIKNQFSLDYNDIKNYGDDYRPTHMIKNESIKERNGTTITLLNIKRNSDIDKEYIDKLSQNIIKRMQIFDENFKVDIELNVEGEENYSVSMSNEMYIETIKQRNDIQFEWLIPDALEELNIDKEIVDFFNSKNIKGNIFTTDTPLKKDDQGIILYANGKLCQENYVFNDRANDNFYSYLSGYLEVDYIDSDLIIDNISTARDSLVWENPLTQELRDKIDIVIKKIQSKWRAMRKEEKTEKINKELKVDVDSWINSLNTYEQKSARKIIDVVINDDNVDLSKTTEFIGYIQDMYSFSAFKDFAENLIDNDEEIDAVKVIEYIKKWNLIEAKEMAKVAIGRIETIEKFEEMITKNESETKVIQPFLESFPWILDPRIITFKREATFASLLKAEFPDKDLEEANRRMDFICHKSNDEIFILELKRPDIKISAKYIEQIHAYQAFAQKNYPNTKVTTYLISNNWKCDPAVQSMIDAAKATRVFGIKSYSEMLTDARQYHSDLVEKYEMLKEIQKEELAN